MNFRRLYELMFRPWPAVRDRAELVDFIDAQSSFVVQKGIYEYSRARAGHYAKVLFSEPDFAAAFNKARWSAYPLGLAMVTEVVDAALLPFAPVGRPQRLGALRTLVVARFDRYPQPAVLDASTWSDLRTDLERRLQLIGLHAPKRAMDIPEPYAKRYFDLMPIHKSLRGQDFLTTHNYLKIALCNVHDELTRRVDGPTVAEALRDAESAAPSQLA